MEWGEIIQERTRGNPQRGEGRDYRVDTDVSRLDWLSISFSDDSNNDIREAIDEGSNGQ